MLVLKVLEVSWVGIAGGEIVGKQISGEGDADWWGSV